MKKAALVFGIVAAQALAVSAFAQVSPDGTAGTVNQPNLSQGSVPNLTSTHGNPAAPKPDPKAVAGKEQYDKGSQKLGTTKPSTEEKAAAVQKRRAEGAEAAKESQTNAATIAPPGNENTVKPGLKQPG